MPSQNDLTSDPEPLASVAGVFLGEFDVTLRGPGSEFTALARFFYNHHRVGSAWLELPLAAQKWSPHTKIEISAPGRLQSFPAHMGTIMLRQRGTSLSHAVRIDPAQEPLQSAGADGLKQVT